MRLGRDYTNCLVFDYLSERQKRAIEAGKLGLDSVDATVAKRAKSDVEGQIEVTRELGMNHIELDADYPNPYLKFDRKRRKEVREAAESNDVTLSVHLPYTYTSPAICCPQEEDRRLAVDLHKRYIEFASDVGAKYAITHPGNAPRKYTIGRYRDLMLEALLKSLIELGKLATEGGVALHLENNTAFGYPLTEVDECIEIVREIRGKDIELYFNFDIGHWFTRVDVGKPIPPRPESALKQIPAELIKELHLTDYIPGERIFHIFIHLQLGPLKRDVLERYAKIVKRKKVEAIVLETALRDRKQVPRRKELLREETEYVREIFGV
ncbi:MAG: sugar phosphate isomerase/epimerase [Candidatus Hadarchaeota archaeon]|nr:sugar phosphate isomerase/epimerase [Candidatus Hadarchaeota archaeon]